jgi:hypothetical protein
MDPRPPYKGRLLARQPTCSLSVRRYQDGRLHFHQRDAMRAQRTLQEQIRLSLEPTRKAL